MGRYLQPFCLLWILFQCATSAPVEEVPNRDILKRATMGPMIDGANFPGEHYLAGMSSIWLIKAKIQLSFTPTNGIVSPRGQLEAAYTFK